MGNEGEASKLLGIVIALEMKGGQWAIRDCDCIGNEGWSVGELWIVIA